MGTLADHIEQYLKRLLARAGEGVVEVRRAELAAMFDCVPSQINYVLSTRFTPDRGYLVETRRGGGGYIRIVRCSWGREDDLYARIARRVGHSISAAEAEDLLIHLQEAGAISPRERAILTAALQRETAWAEEAWRDAVRATLLRAMLLVVLQS